MFYEGMSRGTFAMKVLGVVGMLIGVPLAITGIVTGIIPFMAAGVTVAVFGYGLTRMDTSD